MHGPDGRDYPNRIIFLEVLQPERLVYKHSGDADTEPVNFQVTVVFEADGHKTNLRMQSVFTSAEDSKELTGSMVLYREKPIQLTGWKNTW